MSMMVWRGPMGPVVGEELQRKICAPLFSNPWPMHGWFAVLHTNRGYYVIGQPISVDHEKNGVDIRLRFMASIDRTVTIHKMLIFADPFTLICDDGLGRSVHIEEGYEAMFEWRLYGVLKKEEKPVLTNLCCQL